MIKLFDQLFEAKLIALAFMIVSFPSVASSETIIMECNSKYYKYEKSFFGSKKVSQRIQADWKPWCNENIIITDKGARCIKAAEEDMGKITGQKPVITKFKKSVANFKTRKGSNAGLKVTLRKNKMYEFIDRLVNIALPRIKDFRGLSPKGFDKFGNYTFGVKEHIIFPEVSFDRADKVRGLDIVVVIKALNKDHAFALLEKMNFPFIKKGDN